MKKIVSLLLFIMMISSVVFADSYGFEVGYGKNTNNVYIAGNLLDSVEKTGDFVSIILQNKNNGNIEYIEQLAVNTDKTYETKFKFNGNIFECVLRVKDGENDVTESVTVAKVDIPVVATIQIRDENSNHKVESGEIVKALGTLENKYGNSGTYKVLVAFYNAESLISVEPVTDGSYNFYDISKKLEGNTEISVPEDADKIKAFVWSDSTSIMPLSKAAEKNLNDSKFDGESGQITVAFIGDSITHGAQYLKGIEHYYQTRYPGKDIVFVNKGISGNLAKSVIARFDWDVTEDIFTGQIDEATLMIGMNDVMRSYYDPANPQTQEKKDAAIESCINNIETIIGLCKEKDISLTLITPSAYDESESFAAASANYPGCNSYGLKTIAEKVSELADEYDLPLIDFWTPTTEVIEIQREKGNTGVVIARTDRVHPDAEGGFYMAYQFIKQQDGNPIVASVSVDAGNVTVISENADVVLNSASSSSVEYSYLPKAIPMAYTDYYKNAENVLGASVTDDVNREMIYVDGLEAGEYKILIDQIELSKTYTADELKNGVNISIDVNNPGQIQAMEAYKISETKVTRESTYRSIAVTEQQMMAYEYVTLDDIKSYKWDKLSKGVSQLIEEHPTWPSNFYAYIGKYSDGSGNNTGSFGYKPKQSENINQIRNLELQAREKSIPVLHQVIITKK